MRVAHLLAAAIAAAIVVFVHVDSSPRVTAQAAPAPAGVFKLAVRLKQGAKGEDVVARHGAAGHFGIRGLRNWRVLRFADAQGAAAALAQLRADPDVEQVIEQRPRQRFTRTNDPLFGDQWHLKNTGQSGGTAGIDLNCEPAWNNGVTGTGVRVAIVDDGLQHTHPDLQPNYSATNSFDYVGGDSNPAPGSGDNHGTACAGLVAAKGENSLGVAGAAYDATLSGIRLLGPAMTDADEAAALTHDYDANHIYSNSWGPFDNGDYSDIGPLAKAAIEDGVANGRGGLGNIYVWAGGNGRGSGDYANYDGYVSLPETICVGSISDDGIQASYSESGACLMVCAPGSEGNVTTTDRTGGQGYDTGDYVDFFNGTSAACPMAAGVIGLMLDANPNLTWRDVQHILARTSTRNDAADGDWSQNGAGRWVNHKYGFGLIDAEAAVDLATNWATVAARVTVNSTVDNASLAIPDNDLTGVTRIINVPGSLYLEHVVVNFFSNHGDWGDLQVTLTSPDGTVSELSKLHTGASPSGTWRFMSTRLWGEDAQGDWTLHVADRQAGQTGDLLSWNVTLYGTAAPVPDPLFFTDGVPPSGQAHVAYTHTFVADGGTPPYTYAVTSGTLPNGLILDANTGELAGTPTQAGSYDFTVTATTAAPVASGSKNVTLDIAGLMLVNFNPPDALANSGYSYTFTASGGTPPYTFSVAGGNLPDGLMLDANTGALTGTPTTVNTFNFTIEVTCAAPVETDSEAVDIVISAAPLAITNVNPPDGEVGAAYTHTFGANNGIPPLTFSITGGTLPPGLSLFSSTGELSGTPTTAGTFNFTVRVSQPAPPDQSSAPCSITIDPAGLTLTNANAPDGTVGAAYTHTFGAANGAPPLTFAVTAGTLPPGLTLNSSTGQLSGTPTMAGSYGFTVQVSQPSPADSHSVPVSMDILDAPPPGSKSKKGGGGGGCAAGAMPALGPLWLLGLAALFARRRRPKKL